MLKDGKYKSSEGWPVELFSGKVTILNNENLRSNRIQTNVKSIKNMFKDNTTFQQKLFPQVKSGVIYKGTRSWERPSDHVPIILEIDI